MDESRKQQLIHRRMWFEYALRHLKPGVPVDDHRAEGIHATIAHIDAELGELESAVDLGGRLTHAEFGRCGTMAPTIRSDQGVVMVDAQSFVHAAITLAYGVLSQHRNFDHETYVAQGPGDHVVAVGSVLDAATRARMMDEGVPLRGGFVDAAFDNEGDGALISLSVGQGNFDKDVFVPFTASLVEASALITREIDAYIEHHFGNDDDTR